MAVIKRYFNFMQDIGSPGGSGQVIESGDGVFEVTGTMMGISQRYVGHDFVIEDGKLVGGVVTEYMSKFFGEVAYHATGYEWDASQGPLDVLGGDDTVSGSGEDDYLSGGAGDDRIRGGKGWDQIYGGEGRDTMYGGVGADQFVYHIADGKDTIADFDMAGRFQDHISIVAPVGHDHLAIKQRGHDTVFNFGDGDKLILRDIDRHDLSRDNFTVTFDDY